MNEDNMSDMMQKLSSMLGGKEVPADLKNIFNNFVSSNNTNSNSNNSDSSDTSTNTTEDNNSSNSSDNSNPFGNIDIGTILKMKSIMDKMNSKKDDPRTNLLLSLKPYLKPSRKQKVDQYIQLFNMGDIFESLNVSGGDKNK